MIRVVWGRENYGERGMKDNRKQDMSIDRLREGNKADFDLFYNQYYALFLSFALRFLPDREACRDVVQEIFVQYWKRRSAFQDFISVKVFFYRSIRNECLNQWKRLRVHDKFVNSELQKIDDHEYFLDNIVREEVAFTVHQKIKDLSPMEQRVLALTMDGKSNEEIARELTVSINTVKTHKARAYALLRGTLRELRFLIGVLGI